MVKIEFDEEHENWLRPHADDMAEMLAQRTTERIERARRYVDHPDEVPEGYEVQEGPRGGTYYETDDDEEGDDGSPGEPFDVEQLEEGDEIVFEHPEEGQISGTVDTVFTSPNGENHKVRLRSDAVSGWTWTKPEEIVGYVDELVGGEADTDAGDLTGATVLFENGQRAVVIDGEGPGLHVEMLTGPNEGEDLYGVTRDEIAEILEEERPEIPDDYVAMPEFDDMHERAEWMKEHAYVDQHLKVYDRREETVVDAYVDTFNQARGSARANVEGVDGYSGFEVGDSNRYDVLGVRPWEDLDHDEAERAMRREYQKTRKRSIDDETVKKVEQNFFDRGSLTRAKDTDTVRRVAEGLSMVKDEVSRASCTGQRGSGSYTIKVSEDEDHDVIAHELGHGIAQSFGYSYFHENSDMPYGPWKLSHEYEEYAGSWGDFIDWDFSEGSSFYDAEEYMFSKWDDDGDVEDYAVGYDEFKEEVEQEVEERFRTEADKLEERWSALEFEEIDEDTPSGSYVVNEADEGDIVQVRVPDWDGPKDEDGNPTEYRIDLAKVDETYEYDSIEGLGLVLERPSGDQWSWMIQADGTLKSNYDSRIVGVTDPPETTDEETDATSDVDPDQADSLTEHLAIRWDGFNGEAEDPGEKADNLMRAVNRAWYKQAKVHEATVDDERRFTERQQVVMETGYSASNAHETIAQLHEVMQTPTDGNRNRANDIVREHPYLVLAYLDMWEVPEEIMGYMDKELKEMGVDV